MQVTNVVCVLHDADNWVKFMFHVTGKCRINKVCGRFPADFRTAYDTLKQACVQVCDLLSTGDTNVMWSLDH